MILGIGNDILSENRIEKVYNKFKDKFLNRILSPEESEMIIDIKKSKKISFITKRFSAKESFLKAIGIGIGRGILMKNITIKNNKLGKPEIFIDNTAENFIENYFKINDIKKINFFLSITDENKLVSTVLVIDYVN